ncbi:hypothetical protein GMMP13_120016 [Candidatus Magnetomoraceae bacterium gMMP-13]
MHFESSFKLSLSYFSCGKIYFIHILPLLKFTLAINLYFPPPILKMTHIPTISAVPKVFFNAEKEEKLFFLHIVHHLSRGAFASGYFFEKSFNICRAITCMNNPNLGMKIKISIGASFERMGKRRIQYKCSRNPLLTGASFEQFAEPEHEPQKARVVIPY